MSIYRKRLVIQDTKQVVLDDLPFQSGQEVEVTLRLTKNTPEVQNKTLRTLFKTTQQLPQIKTLTEDEILAEIKTYRNDL